MIEYRAGDVLRQLQCIERERLAWIDVKPAAMATSNTEHQRAIAATAPWQAGVALVTRERPIRDACNGSWFGFESLHILPARR
jgi:hypothetical protein